MNKVSINEMVKAVLRLQANDHGFTLIGIGPMSRTLIKASLELGKERDFPLMYIASRNQVDAKPLGGGYVCDWDQYDFKNTIAEIAKEVEFDGLYYLCRDHGGPWQRDNERNSHLAEDVAMNLAKASYIEDIKSGFDLLHIDPTKDPHEVGKVVPLDIVLQRTVELIEYCEDARKNLHLPPIGYEVGTEETNGGLTSMETYEAFIQMLNKELSSKNLPQPIFIVGQTGTLVRMTKNVGTFNATTAKGLADTARKYGVGLKEHNGDYVSDDILLLHPSLGITATNVAPEFGKVETRALLELVKVEQQAFEHGLIDQLSNLGNDLLIEAINSERWRKWMIGPQTNLDRDSIFENQELAKDVLDIAGHYTFNTERVKNSLTKLYENLAKIKIDGERYVINKLKVSINTYVDGFNLEGSTSSILKEAGNA